MIRVFVADDHAVVRDGLARILDAVPDMTYSGATDSIRGAVRWLRTITDPIASRLVDSGTSNAEALTTRELQILQLVAEGKQTSTIASALGLSASTVSTHLKRIKEKLAVGTQADLV